MRCPKCGYLSFDQISECLKCGKNIADVSSSFMGSVRNVTPPAFLRLDEEPLEEEPSADLFGGVEGEDYVDRDLEVLVDTEEEDDELEISLSEDDEEFSLEETEDPEEDEIEIDMAQFEAEDESDQADELEEEDDAFSELRMNDTLEQPALEVPEELADISDLEPPAVSSLEESVEEEPEKVVAAPVDQKDDELSLNDLNFDLDIDVEEDEGDPAIGDTTMNEETVLSLDDLDFSDALGTPEKSKKKSKKDEIDMDEELNFDLDLGGLSIHDDI